MVQTYSISVQFGGDPLLHGGWRWKCSEFFSMFLCVMLEPELEHCLKCAYSKSYIGLL